MWKRFVIEAMYSNGGSGRAIWAGASRNTIGEHWPTSQHRFWLISSAMIQPGVPGPSPCKLLLPACRTSLLPGVASWLFGAVRRGNAVRGGRFALAYRALNHSGERGIGGIAVGSSTVESLWIGRVQSGSELQAPRQIRVGQKRSAVGDSVGMSGP